MEKTLPKLAEITDPSNSSTTVRIGPEAREVLNGILQRVNSKEQGRTVKAGEVVAVALSLVTSKEVKALQEASLSNADRLALSYQKHIRENPNVSYDDFLGLILKNSKKGGTNVDGSSESGN